MPCSNENHTHVWSTEGELTIERCEKVCYFCSKPFKHAWFVRRHVKDVHLKSYPNLILKGGWSGSPNGNRRPNSPDKRGKRSRTPSTTRTMSMVRERTEEFTPPDATNNLNGWNALPSNDQSVLDANFDIAERFAMPSGAGYSAVSSFVTPQSVRTSGVVIEGVIPSMDHHGAAGVLAEGLNGIVGDVVASGTMTEQEIVYVLETFTGMLKVGIAAPLTCF